jgi:hypothetical protein
MVASYKEMLLGQPVAFKMGGTVEEGKMNFYVRNDNQHRKEKGRI